MGTKQVICTLLAFGVLAGSTAIVQASDLSKAAKAVQYSTRKDASNLSIDTHRALHHNSVEKRHNGPYKHKSIITPAGDVVRMHPHHVVRHRRHHH